MWSPLQWLPRVGRARQPVAGRRHSHLRRTPALPRHPEQMVASIISKKLAAGSTHLLIDMPVGPTAKLANATTRCVAQALRVRRRPLRHCRRGDHDRRPPTDRQRHRSGTGGWRRHGRPDQRAGRPGRPAGKIAAACGASTGIRSAIARRRGLCARPRIARQRRGHEENAGNHRRAGTIEVPQRYRQADLRRPRRR